MEEEIRFKYYDSKESFIKHLSFVRGFFADGEWVDVVSKRYVHQDGITKELATSRYYEEIVAYQKWKEKNEKFPRLLNKLLNTRTTMPLHKEYQAMLSLMDVLGKDILTVEDVESVLANPDYFYDKYFDKNIKNKKCNDGLNI